MAREMSTVEVAQQTVGASGSVVGDRNSQLMNTVTNVIMAGITLNILEGKSGLGMRMGDSLSNVLGGGGEAFTTKPNGEMAKLVTGGLLLAGTFKLMDAMSSNPQPLTQDQIRAQAAAQEDRAKAEFYRQDAQMKDAQAQEDQRRAFFAKKDTPGM